MWSTTRGTTGTTRLTLRSFHERLGWLPQTGFAEGIVKMVRWYLDSRSWWEEIVSEEYQTHYE